MTLNHSYSASIHDIQSLKVTCPECEFSISIPLHKLERFHTVCRQCEKSWFQSGSSDHQGIGHLVKGLLLLSQRTKEAKPLIELEIPLPKT
jgi:hypothetical protein